MRITTSKPVPALQELIEVLRREFSSQHSYAIFGLGNQKSIMVGKTLITGVQLSTHENEISIQATAPSLGTGYALAFLSLTWVGTVFGGLVSLFRSPKTSGVALEKEIALFLKKKYG